MKFQVTRTVTPKECPWLKETVRQGMIVYLYHGATYSAISEDGIAVTLEPDTTPFFEIPRNAIVPAA